MENVLKLGYQWEIGIVVRSLITKRSGLTVRPLQHHRVTHQTPGFLPEAGASTTSMASRSCSRGIKPVLHHNHGFIMENVLKLGCQWEKGIVVRSVITKRSGLPVRPLQHHRVTHQTPGFLPEAGASTTSMASRSCSRGIKPVLHHNHGFIMENVLKLGCQWEKEIVVRSVITKRSGLTVRPL